MRTQSAIGIFLLVALLVGCAIPASAAPPPTTTPQTAGAPGRVGVTPTAIAKPGTTIQDCGDDMVCFIAASASCATQARVQSTTSIDFFGIVPTTTTLYEIRGRQDGMCIFYTRMLEARVAFSEDMVAQLAAAGSSEEEIAAAQEEMNQSLQREVGTAQTCQLNPDELTAMLQRWSEGSFSTGDYPPGACTPPAKEE